MFNERTAYISQKSEKEEPELFDPDIFMVDIYSPELDY